MIDFKIKELPRTTFINLHCTSAANLHLTKKIRVTQYETILGKRFRVAGVIQFNSGKEHFRTIRSLYTASGMLWILLDTEAITLRGKFPEEINPTDPNWTNSTIRLEQVR